MLFSSDLVASYRPMCVAARFQKVMLEPGETKTVTMPLPANDLAFVNAQGKWTLEAENSCCRWVPGRDDSLQGNKIFNSPNLSPK